MTYREIRACFRRADGALKGTVVANMLADNLFLVMKDLCPSAGSLGSLAFHSLRGMDTVHVADLVAKLPSFSSLKRLTLGDDIPVGQHQAPWILNACPQLEVCNLYRLEQGLDCAVPVRVFANMPNLHSLAIHINRARNPGNGILNVPLLYLVSPMETLSNLDLSCHSPYSQQLHRI